jgi:APA family basic amino acid/polyamine antiporter
MAAVAITFARHFLDLMRWPVPDAAVASCVLALLTVVNCLGVRAGSNVQNVLMLLKIGAILALVAGGVWLATPYVETDTPAAAQAPFGLIGAIGAALTPVMFAYGGWQTASFLAAEMRDPRRDLARGVVLGVSGVVVLYTAVAWACVRTLGPQALAESRTPATTVMLIALGETGATLIALGIAVSALGSSVRACCRRRACTSRWRRIGSSSRASDGSTSARTRRSSQSCCRAPWPSPSRCREPTGRS